MRLADDSDYPSPDLLSALSARYSDIGLNDLDAIGYVTEPVLHLEMILLVDRRQSVTNDPDGKKFYVSLFGPNAPETPLAPEDFE